jgi:nitrite reductase (NADH) small subunit
MTERWYPVGCIADIPRRGARCVRHGETTIAVFRAAEDRIFALEDKCPHRGRQLSGQARRSDDPHRAAA